MDFENLIVFIRIALWAYTLIRKYFPRSEKRCKEKKRTKIRKTQPRKGKKRK